MDRRMLNGLTCLALGVALVVAGSGCHNLRQPEIPPEPAYETYGSGEAPQVGFSSQPASSVNPYGAGMAGANPAMAGTNPSMAGYGADPSYSNQPAMVGAGAGAGAGAYGPSAYDPGSSMTGAGMSAGVPDPEPLQGLPDMGSGGAGIAAPSMTPGSY